MNKESFEEFENLCNAVFGNVGNGNTQEARERLESICLQPSFVEKAETIFQNSKNIYALHATGTSLTTVMTEYWNNFDVDQKLRIRDFIMEYVIQNGYQLPNHITSVLCTLICRITSLSWMVDERQRSILELMLKYTNAREHSVLALSILEELVNQITPSSKSSIQQNQTAIQFRDNVLLNIIHLSFNLLKDISNDTVTSPLHFDIYEHALKLLTRCFTFESKKQPVDDGLEAHPILSLPSKWYPEILTTENVNLLHFIYTKCSPPLTATVLEVLLWMLSANRSDLHMACSDSSLLDQIVLHLLNIMNTGYGLDDPETIHVFVQLLDRYKAISNFRQLLAANNHPFLTCIANFTQVLLHNLYEYSNSLKYLFHYWYKVCLDLSRFTSESFQSFGEFVHTNVVTILTCYINKRLSDCADWVNDREDDVLMNMDGIYWELFYLGSMARFQYETTVKEIITIFDDLKTQYMNECRRVSTMKMTGMVDADVMRTVTTFECKLAWLVNIIAFILRGEKFTSTQMEREEESLDAELCKRVFSLNHSLNYRMNSANYSRVDPRLEISFVNFFNAFREVYALVLYFKFSTLSRQGISDALPSGPPLSGFKMAAFHRFFEKVSIGDYTSVMNTIVEKVCCNLRNWSDEDKVIEASLNLFLELSEPYYGCKLLLQLESIDFLLQNHTEDTFKFLASPSLLALRTTYYASLTKLVLMDNIPGRLEMFLTPFSTLLQRLGNEDLSNPSYGLVLIKIYKDLRGVIDSCNDKRSYNIVFETLFSHLAKVMNRTIDSYGQNDELIGAMFKCLQSFIHNRNSRVDSGSTSTNGIMLFKNTANLICSFTQHRFMNINYNQVSEALYRCIRLMLQIMYLALSGKYVPFGVFSLYNDTCLRNSLEACMTIILQLPSYQVEKRQKLGKAAYNFIDILFTNHLETLSQMSSEYFINLVRFVVNGIDSFDSETVAHCADCVDQLATFYYLNRQRTLPTMERLQAIVVNNPTLWKDLFEKIMNSLLFNKGSPDMLSRPLQSIFLVDAGVAESYYGTVASTQPSEVVGKLKDSMVKLTTNMDVTLEPMLRDQFCEKCNEFRTEVLSYLVL